jgi:hypothetical protein
MWTSVKPGCLARAKRCTEHDVVAMTYPFGDVRAAAGDVELPAGEYSIYAMSDRPLRAAMTLPGLPAGDVRLGQAARRIPATASTSTSPTGDILAHREHRAGATLRTRGFIGSFTWSNTTGPAPVSRVTRSRECLRPAASSDPVDIGAALDAASAETCLLPPMAEGVGGNSGHGVGHGSGPGTAFSGLAIAGLSGSFGASASVTTIGARPTVGTFLLAFPF